MVQRYFPFIYPFLMDLTFSLSEKVSLCSRGNLLLLLHTMLGGSSFGYNLGIIANAQFEIQRQFGSIGSVYLGFLSSCLLIGTTVGAFIAGFIANRFGRRLSSAIAVLIALTGGMILPFLHNIPFIIAFRSILGIGLGIMTVVTPMYVSEMAHKDQRGFISSFFQISITFGLLVAYLVGYGLSYPRYDNEQYSWRIMFAIGILPALVHIFIIAFNMKESTLWKAKRDSKRFTTHEERQEMKRALYKGTPFGWSGLFSRRKFRVLSVGLVLAATLQLTGINGLVIYMPHLFTTAGLEDLAPILTILVGVINFLSPFISLFLVDRVGRRPLILIGLVIMSVSLLVLAIIFMTLSGTTLGWISFAFISLFHIGFEISPGTMFWVVVNELYYPGVKAQANSLMTMLNWIYSFIVTMTFPVIYEAISYNTFFIFFAISVLCFIHLIIFYKEGKGKAINPDNFHDSSDFEDISAEMSEVTQ